MSRTVCVRTIKKIGKAEIAKFEAMTRKEIVLDYENVLSLFAREYVSDTYSSLQKHMTRIKTIDGYDLYIAHTKILEIVKNMYLFSDSTQRFRGSHLV